MAAIREVEIRNFRGISHLKWRPRPGLNCLIGPGDAGKSTILDAIELALGSRQSFTFSDADFHRCNISEPIIIDITLGGLDDELINLEAYGHFLRGWDSLTGNIENEPAMHLETVLTLRLTVRDDLEPQWLLHSEGAGAEGRERNLQWKHRQKVAPVRLGTVAAHHMALGPRSILGKLSADATQASAALAGASRQARQAFADRGCEGVEPILEASKRIADNMGIRVEEVRALLDVRGVTLSGGAIALHDEDHVPMKSLGSGSMRLLVAGLQKEVGQSSIFIIDELEFGLEPYRIVRLLDSLGAKNDDGSQQVFMTTHSPIVLRELSAPQLFTVRTERTTSPPALSFDDLIGMPATKVTANVIRPLGGSEEAQKTLRACAEAFLAPSIIVCEGKTEIGLVRGLDLWLQDSGNRSLLSRGCHWADGAGSTMMERAQIFAAMGYRTALFMDSDVQYAHDVYAGLAAAGVEVVRWQDGFSTETAIFAGVPAARIPDLLRIAMDWRGEDSVNARIQRLSNNRYSLQTCLTSFTEDMRTILGQGAGEGKWFKDIEPAERVAREVFAFAWSDSGAAFTAPVARLMQWAGAWAVPVAPVQTALIAG
ncbi:recombination protein F [Sphingopyxis sp. LC81]|uniref:ATP-dependent nuclease n=1 Tax=Sphingopyxis sp. LC81 TaxID=1502850 RepID=UPI00050F72E4|nr:ATP-binding protein [Sphingopyxis sp. LC81]KGB55950.1 recombination protein F [Sphingopyxis sp. LC81]